MVWDSVKRYVSPPEGVLEAAEEQAKQLAERQGLSDTADPAALERLREQVTYIKILSSLDVRGRGCVVAGGLRPRPSLPPPVKGGRQLTHPRRPALCAAPRAQSGGA